MRIAALERRVRILRSDRPRDEALDLPLIPAGSPPPTPTTRVIAAVPPKFEARLANLDRRVRKLETHLPRAFSSDKTQLVSSSGTPAPTARSLTPLEHPLAPRLAALGEHVRWLETHLPRGGDCDQNIVTLGPYEGGNWNFTGQVGYYIHRGRVYLQGEIDSSNAPTVTQTILTGFPAALCPAADVALTLVTDLASDDTATAWDYASGNGMPSTDPAALTQLPLTFAATMRPDGTLTLDDALPTYVNATPPGTYTNGGTHPRYFGPLFLAILLAGASWEIKTLADSYTSIPITPLDATNFTDDAATMAAHIVRVHLGGGATVTTAGEGQDEITAGSFPSDYADDPIPGVSGLSYAVADGSRGWWGLRLPHASGLPELQLITDLYNPSSWTPSGAIPAFNGLQQAKSFSGSGGADFEYGFLSCPDDPFNLSPPIGGPIPSAVADLSSTLAALEAQMPAPDWVAVLIGGLGSIVVAIGGSPGAATCSTDADPAFYDWAISTPCRVFDLNLVPGASGSLEFGGWLQRASSAYSDDPSAYTDVLWRPSEIPSTVTISFLGNAHDGSWALPWSIVPFYEKRKRYLRPGDTLDFTPTGWQRHASHGLCT